MFQFLNLPRIRCGGGVAAATARPGRPQGASLQTPGAEVREQRRLMEPRTTSAWRYGYYWAEWAFAVSLVILGIGRGVAARATPDGGKAIATPGAELRPQRREPTVVPPEGLPPADSGPSSRLSKKQKQDLLKSNFERMKRDADELAELAKSLQDDLSKSNENVFSLKVVDKAERIEKLAKKIKSTARGY